jgi:hypothetical protein
VWLRVEDDRRAGVRLDEQINAMTFLQNVPSDSFFGSEGVQSWIHLYPKYIASNEKKIALVYAESKNDKGTDFTSPQV